VLIHIEPQKTGCSRTQQRQPLRDGQTPQAQRGAAKRRDYNLDVQAYATKLPYKNLWLLVHQPLHNGLCARGDGGTKCCAEYWFLAITHVQSLAKMLSVSASYEHIFAMK
jgi:hypothetical protein